MQDSHQINTMLVLFVLSLITTYKHHAIRSVFMRFGSKAQNYFKYDYKSKMTVYAYIQSVVLMAFYLWAMKFYGIVGIIVPSIAWLISWSLCWVLAYLKTPVDIKQ